MLFDNATRVLSITLLEALICVEIFHVNLRFQWLVKAKENAREESFFAEAHGQSTEPAMPEKEYTMRTTPLAVAITACFSFSCGGDVERENDDLIVPIPDAIPCDESATIWVNSNAGGTVTCNTSETWEGSFVTSGVITMPLCDDTLEAFVELNDPEPPDGVTFVVVEGFDDDGVPVSSETELVFERQPFSARGTSYQIEAHVFEATAPVVVTIAIPSL